MFPHKATKIMNLYVLILLFFFPRFRLMLFPFFSSFFGSLSFVVSVFSRQITFFFFYLRKIILSLIFQWNSRQTSSVQQQCGLCVDSLWCWDGGFTCPGSLVPVDAALDLWIAAGVCGEGECLAEAHFKLNPLCFVFLPLRRWITDWATTQTVSSPPEESSLSLLS